MSPETQQSPELSLPHVVSETRAMGLKGEAQLQVRQSTLFSCELKDESGVCALVLSRVPRRRRTVPGGAFYCHSNGGRGGFMACKGQGHGGSILLNKPLLAGNLI